MELDTGENTVHKTYGWEAPDGADPFNHYMTGYHWDGRSFTVPALTQVTDTLWHGGYVKNLDLKDNFDGIVSLYPWERYKADCPIYEYELYDGSEVDVQTVHDATDRAVIMLEAGDKVLVHCQAGLNRSSLVIANILIEYGGIHPEDAIALLRQKRSPEVLFNTKFVSWLLNKAK